MSVGVAEGVGQKIEIHNFRRLFFYEKNFIFAIKTAYVQNVKLMRYHID